MRTNEKILENLIAVSGSNAAAMNQAVYQHPAGADNSGRQLYNGNISNTTIALSKIDNGVAKGYSYGYNQLNWCKMKALQLKFPVILLLIFLITVLSLSNCGQQENAKDTVAKTEPAKKEMQPTVIITDSQASVPANKVNVENAGNTQQEVKADLKKEIIPIDKKKEPEPVKKSTVEQPVVSDKKQTSNTNITPPNDKPVVKPEENPVVNVTEPIKPKTDTLPKVPNITKPVTNDKPQPEQGAWIVPAKYKSMTSPFAVDKEFVDLGRSLYGTHCKSCHGGKGDGNGPKAAQIDTKIKSFLTAEFQTQNPGEIYYKSIIGRGDMPKFEKKIPDDEDRWAIVHYIMSLKK